MKRLASGVIAALAACGAPSVGPSIGPDFPTTLDFTAEAEGVAGGRTVRCSLDFHVMLERRGDHWFGSWGGEIHRLAIDATGAGVEFFGDSFAELRVDIDGSGAVTLRSYRDGRPLPPDGSSRFWDGILEVRGRLAAGDGAVVAEGAWTCQPMDARGDSVGAVTGQWRLTAAN
ncbi:MAG: hypothetical protein AB7L66_00030 [Gemmatimonadales bacterium]